MNQKNIGDEKTKLFERIRNTSAGANESLMMQIEFFADAICEFMPFQPEIWNGGMQTKQIQSVHLRLIWSTSKSSHLPSKSQKYIEFLLSDKSKGFLDVNGNRTSIVWLATEEGAKEAFKSAFEFIFGEKADAV